MTIKRIILFTLLTLTFTTLLTGCDKYYGKLQDDFDKKGETVYSLDELKEIKGEKIPVLLSGNVDSNVIINDDFFTEDLDELVAMKLREEEYVTKTKTVDGKKEKYKTWVFDDNEYHEPTKLYIADMTIDLKSKYVNKNYHYSKIRTTRELKKYIDYDFINYIDDGIFRDGDERYEYSIIRKNDIKGVLGYVTDGEFLMNEEHSIYIID